MWNGIYRILRLRTLTHRLFFWMFLFIILSVTVFLMLYTAVDKKASIHLANKRLKQSVEKQKVIVEDWTNERFEEIGYIAEIEEIKEGIYDGMGKPIQFYANHLSDVNAFVVLDKNGHVVIDSTSDDPYANADIRLDDRVYFKEVKNKDLYISDIVMGRSGLPVMIFSVPVVTNDNEFGGVVFASVSLSTIHTLLENTTIGITGNVLFLNPGGVSLPESEQLGNVLTTGNHTNIVQSATAGNIPQLIYENNNGKQVTGTYTSLFDQRFFLIHEMEKEEILQTHNEVIRTVIILIVFITMIGVILISIILWGILRSFTHFTEAIQGVKEGNYRYETDTILYKQSPSEVRSMMDIFSEMTRTIEEKNREMVQKLKTDALTGIFNRGAFSTMIEETWDHAHTNKEPIALAFIDIDFFKRINDAFGHVVGDDILIQMANDIEESITHTNGTLFRYGGEEFVILFPQTDEQTAYHYAEMVRKRIEQADIRHEDGSLVTISVGVTSTIPQDDHHPRVLIQAVDHALYKAKNAGRNRVEITSIEEVI